MGIPSTLDPFFVALEVCLPGSPFDPSNNYIAKHVFLSGKVIRVSFRGEDVLEESRLMAFEIRDGATKAAMGADRSVP